ADTLPLRRADRLLHTGSEPTCCALRGRPADAALDLVSGRWLFLARHLFQECQPVKNAPSCPTGHTPWLERVRLRQFSSRLSFPSIKPNLHTLDCQTQVHNEQPATAGPASVLLLLRHSRPVA